MSHTAVIAWGSLLWSPRNLRVTGRWEPTGPRLPIEFSRVTTDGRLTLVVDPVDGVAVQTWVARSPLPPDDARRNLAEREACAIEHIGIVRRETGNGANQSSSPLPTHLEPLANWFRAGGFRAAIWTALPTRFATVTGAPFSVTRGLSYLNGLRGATRDVAFEYIRRAPETTRTPLSQAFAMTDQPPYSPIDCSVHDRLEAFATLQTRCRIAFRTDEGEAVELVDRIVDVFTRGAEEFLRSASGQEVRLDRLDSVEEAR
ncbi:MAG: hypothetical protein WD960_11850 [Gemmatimonadota bacterium]